MTPQDPDQALRGAGARTASRRRLAGGRLVVGPPIDSGRLTPWACWNVRDEMGRSMIHGGTRHLVIIDRRGQIEAASGRVELQVDHPQWEQHRDALRQQYAAAGIPLAVTSGEIDANPFLWQCWQAETLGVQSTWVELESARLPMLGALQSMSGEIGRLADGAFSSDGELVALLGPGLAGEVLNRNWGRVQPQLCDLTERAEPLGSVDSAFASLRTGSVIRYQLAVPPLGDYYVYLGFCVPAWPALSRALEISVNSAYMRHTFQPRGGRGPQTPAVLEAPVSGRTGRIAVAVGIDDEPHLAAGELAGCNRAFLNGIWVFDQPVDKQRLVRGELSQLAQHYVQVGGERDQILHPLLRLRWEPGAGEERPRRTWIALPSHVRRADQGQLGCLDPADVRSAAAALWEQCLAEGARFASESQPWNQAYRQALTTLLLLRRRAAAARDPKRTVWVPTGGATIHDSWRFRSAALALDALVRAGFEDLAVEAAEPLIEPIAGPELLGPVQQEDGRWRVPGLADGSWSWQGQALSVVSLALRRESESGRARRWYPALCAGAACLIAARRSTEALILGARPPQFGLLPRGPAPWSGDGRQDHWFGDNFWAVHGLRAAARAAAALGDSARSHEWNEEADTLEGALLPALDRAFDRIAKGQFIPAGLTSRTAERAAPLDALYPCRVLPPSDPRLQATLNWLATRAEEQGLIRTGIPPDLEQEPYRLDLLTTAQAAVCHLLSGDAAAFDRSWKALLWESPPGWNWPAWIWEDDGTGGEDMPDAEMAAWLITGSALALACEQPQHLALAQGWRPGEALAGGPWVTGSGSLTVTVTDREGRPDVQVDLRRDDAGRGARVPVTVGHRPAESRPDGIDCWINGQPLSLTRGPVVIEF